MLLLNNQQAHWLVPARIHAAELIDLPGVTDDELSANLDDMAHVNRWLGGAWLTLRALDRLMHDVPAHASLTLLDVATGIADIPHAIAAWAQRRGVQTRVIATDISPQIVQIANRKNREPGRTENQSTRDKETGRQGDLHSYEFPNSQSSNEFPSSMSLCCPLTCSPAHPLITFAATDGLALPFRSKSVDVALCSFALHHLEPAQAIAMLREMGRVARRGVIVNDLVRWQPAYWATWLGTRMFSRSRLTQHDGPLSVLRAYTVAEMHGLVAQAGLRVLALDDVLGYRVALTLASA